jgi:signal peptidase I
MLYFIILFFGPLIYLSILPFLIKPLFEKAGEGANASIPGMNIMAWLRMVKKPNWWIILLLVPVINYMTVYTLAAELLKAYGEKNVWVRFYKSMLSFIFLPMLAKDEKLKYIGPGGVPLGKPIPRKTAAMEWTDSILYAVIAATFIRMLVFEAYNIPTSSMEKTLRVGDFLFVSKFHYGPRLPMTPIAVPFVHHTVPFLETKAFSDIIELPYRRLPGFQKIKNFDMVVFNLPEGDTLTKELDSKDLYYDMVRRYGKEQVFSQYHVTTRPVDKRENYIKRCVGIAGDSIKVKDDVLYINNKEAWKPEGLQFAYAVVTDGTQLPDNLNEMYDFYDAPMLVNNAPVIYRICATPATMAEIARMPNVKNVGRFTDSMMQHMPDAIFPNDERYVNWSVSNFGNLWIPKKGETIKLTPTNIALYRRAIAVYEGNKMEEKGGKVYINDKEASTYTFKMDYYWMMGDNRNNSQDSRYWGYVPEDHIVGKAWIIWMASKKYEGRDAGFRMDRIGTFVHRKYAPH